MSRRGAIPSRFSDIHPKNFTPGSATVWAGVLSVIWYVVISILSSNVLGDCVAGLGFLVCIYYGFTGFACTIYYRHELLKSVRNFVGLALLPTVGGVILMIVLVYGAIFYGHEINDYSPPLLGLGVPDWIGIVGVGGGILLMLWRRAVAPAFFQEPRYVAGETFTVVTAEKEFAPADSML
jgi:amino acid transporter